jgi:hypothetical protein
LDAKYASALANFTTFMKGALGQSAKASYSSIDVVPYFETFYA